MKKFIFCLLAAVMITVSLLCFKQLSYQTSFWPFLVAFIGTVCSMIGALGFVKQFLSENDD